MFRHLLPPGWELGAPLGFVVEVGGEESDGDESPGGGSVASKKRPLVLSKPLNEVDATHERLLYSPFVEFGAASVFVEEFGWEVWSDLVLTEERVVDDLEHVENVGLLGCERGILRSEGDDGKARPERGVWTRFGTHRGGPEWVCGSGSFVVS